MMMIVTVAAADSLLVACLMIHADSRLLVKEEANLSDKCRALCPINEREKE